MMPMDAPQPRSDQALRALVDEYRDRCLWYLRRDYYPATVEEVGRIVGKKTGETRKHSRRPPRGHPMKGKYALSLLLVGLVLTCVPFAPADAQTQERPVVKMPQPGVPEIMTMEGKFVRAAYNNEGYVILGYQGSPTGRSARSGCSSRSA
jgi:hypothetical protein